MKPGHLIGNILLALAVAFTVYLSAVMIRRIGMVVLKKTYIKIFLFELIACVFFTLFAADVRFGFVSMMPAPLKAAGWCLRVLVAAVTAVLLFFIGKITAGSFIRTAEPARHAIVLGLALENGKPAGDLLARLDTAEGYLRDNPDARLILTGGNPDQAGRTEAAVMRDILTGKGVPEASLVLEDQAESTEQNFRNTARLVDPGEPVVLISSNYHMDRAVQMAKKAGFTDVRRLPAPSSALMFGANIMWEMALEINDLFFGMK